MYNRLARWVSELFKKKKLEQKHMAMGGSKAKRFIRGREEGGVAVIVAASVAVLALLTLLVTDTLRVYVVKNKAQQALDAALLGAVTTASSRDVQSEVRRIFNANFQNGYMHALPVQLTVSRLGETDFYRAMAVVRVPSMFSNMGDDFERISLGAEVYRGYREERHRSMELALVLDTTGSMGDPADHSSRIYNLQVAAKNLTDILFGGADTLENLHVSIVPYDIAVNVGRGRESWVRTDCAVNRPGVEPCFDATYNLDAARGIGRISNRNTDMPAEPLDQHDDFTDDPPTGGPESKFRAPFGITTYYSERNPQNIHGSMGPNISPISFALNDKSEIKSRIDALQTGGNTRVPVGLMWGAFTLSPRWQGVWDSGDLAGFPQDDDGSGLQSKVLVLLTDGANSFSSRSEGCSNSTATPPNCPPGSNIIPVNKDNDKLATLCTAVKSRNIKIYTILLGPEGASIATLLRDCASQPNYYFSSPTANDLRQVFQQISDNILLNTVVLTQ